MPSINRPMLRLATAVASQLASRHDAEPLLELPGFSWDRCSELVRQIRRAQLRGWNLAARQLRLDLRFALGSVQSELAAIHARLPSLVTPDTSVRPHDIYRDLLMLEYEFDGLDFKDAWLSVTTAPIELRGVYLGPFEIRLDTRRLAGIDSPPYRIVASDPHPAELRDNVTHPHVMDEILCEGEGRQAIRQALAQGRLLDFFELVAGILRNYNPESPFVELELWHGQTCSDCGTRACEDDCYSCQRCGDMVCMECEVLCTGCEESCCNDCTANCPACESAYCSRCMTRCAECRNSFCPSCLDENERCSNCHEDEPQDALDDNPQENPAPLQPHGLG